MTQESGWSRQPLTRHLGFIPKCSSDGRPPARPRDMPGCDRVAHSESAGLLLAAGQRVSVSTASPGASLSFRGFGSGEGSPPLTTRAVDILSTPTLLDPLPVGVEGFSLGALPSRLPQGLCQPMRARERALCCLRPKPVACCATSCLNVPWCLRSSCLVLHF
ncbi:hypothetical protein MATL_G00186660 [Megalops atlanticus]|uniref:Uncharacterized protein n=1 Tax=Megalops atlanticus TaxID=7932 RepID=A0A9D3PKJ6_MEGAT|nr:hypothetical protein MATL_G00186660 [Megalops atlanticus]